MVQVTGAMSDFIIELADDFANHKIGDQYPDTRKKALRVLAELRPTWGDRYKKQVIGEMEEYYKNGTEPSLFVLGNWIEKLRG